MAYTNFKWKDLCRLQYIQLNNGVLEIRVTWTDYSNICSSQQMQKYTGHKLYASMSILDMIMTISSKFYIASIIYSYV